MTQRRRVLLTAALLCGAGFAVLSALQPPASPQPTATPQPPVTRVENVTDAIHGMAFVDPYRWLEDQDGAETRRWLAAQETYAEQVIGRPPHRARFESRLRELMDRPDVGRPQKGGDFEYFTLRRRGQELAVICRRPAAQSKEKIDAAKPYDVVIDPHPMSAGQTTTVDLIAVERDGKRLIYGVRDGGQDERELRIRDLAAGRDLPEQYPNALYDGASFRADGTGFYYVRRSRQTGARVRFHAWGTPIERDAVVFGEGYGPRSFVNLTQADEGRWFIYTVQHGWARTEVFVQDVKNAGPIVPIVTDADARFYPRFVEGELWMRTDLDASNNRLVAVDLARPARATWRTVVAERDEVMEDFALIGGKLYVTYLRDAANRIRVFNKDGSEAGEVAVPPFSSASIRADGEKQAVLTVESFLAPETTWRIDLETGARTEEDSPEIPWTADAFEVEQVWATSKDGTRLPVFVVRRKDMPKDGTVPVYLTGYGGFYAPSKPRFSPAAAAWLEGGGAYALAILRGGSEYGERWHRAGMLINKPRVFEDFIAAGEWLVANRYTSPARLAIAGVSNGGLLAGAALTMRPDLFRAVVCGFPDVDILRFNQYTHANNMPALLEYGDAAIREQFEVIRQYSPYQHVRPGVAYPAVMVTSGDLDTRVPPLAARKFTSRLQAATSSGRPVILRYHPKAGHATGRGLPLSRRIEDAAAELTFLRTQLGF
jgi:prolyl oligopeptidase